MPTEKDRTRRQDLTEKDRPRCQDPTSGPNPIICTAPDIDSIAFIGVKFSREALRTKADSTNVMFLFYTLHSYKLFPSPYLE